MVAVLVIGTVTYGIHHRGERGEWERRIQRVEGYAAAQTARALNDSLQADSALAVADSLRGVLHEQEQELRERVVVIREEVVPDTCDPFVAPRDTLIDDLLDQNEEWERVADTERQAATRWRSAYGTVRVVNDSLSAVLADRPQPKPWWIPSFGVGPYLGIDNNLKPSYGVAATLSWEIKF